MRVFILTAQFKTGALRYAVAIDGLLGQYISSEICAEQWSIDQELLNEMVDGKERDAPIAPFR